MFWIMAGATLLCDRAAKFFAVRLLREGVSVWVIPGVFRLTLLRNTGMALGLGAGSGWLPVALSVAAVAAGALCLLRFRLGKLPLAAAALMLGGFLGNLIDRAMYGYVVDMCYFTFLPFFVCNPADIAITAGVCMMGASLLLRPQDWVRKHGSAKD